MIPSQALPGRPGAAGAAGAPGGVGAAWSFVDFAKANTSTAAHNATASTICNQFLTTSSTATTSGCRTYWKYSGSGTDSFTVTLWDHNGSVVDTATGTATSDGVVSMSWAGGSHALTAYAIYTVGVYSANGYSYVQASGVATPLLYAIMGGFSGGNPYWYVGMWAGPGCSWFNTGLKVAGNSLPAQAPGSMATMALVEAVITP